MNQSSINYCGPWKTTIAAHLLAPRLVRPAFTLWNDQRDGW